MVEKNFKRIEKKFWMNKQQHIELMTFLNDKITIGDHGQYDVFNLYLDDNVYSLIRNSIIRPYFKEKIRLRCYEIPKYDSKVFLELKRKLDGIGYKRRETMSYSRAMQLINKKVEPETQIEREIMEFINRYNVKPKVVLNYKRASYRLKDDNDFRITFDSELKYALCNENITYDEINNYIMDNPDNVLLEIKTAKAIPIWLSNKLTELEIYQAPFSKIGAVYEKHIKENFKC